jgi:hypothetical protein
MDSLFLNNRVLKYIASIAMFYLLSITAINASILNNQDINLNKTSSANLDLNSFTQGAMISSEDYNWYGSITKSSNTSNNGTWQDFEYYDNQWNQEDTDNITIDVNSTGALFSFPDGFQMATRVVSTYQINSIGETSFSDLYISSVENTVVSSGSGWNDVNDWAPTYWDQENDTQVNVTTPQQLLTMYLVQNNWFSNDYAMLDGNVSDTSGNVVSGSWDGTSYYQNCDEGDCRIIERTENVIGSWEFNGTAINVHLPKEYKTFSLVADQNSPTGFFVSEAGLDKVGSVWNDELLSGADATSQTVQTIFAAIQSAESTPVQNGFTAADINDKIYYVAYTNDDGNISLEKMSFGILNGDNNTTLDFNVSTYINGTLNHDEDFSIQAHLEDNGTITTMWYDQENSCGGSDTYTLLDRNTSNDVATLRVSGSSVSNCDGEESDNWIDTWYLYNGTIIDGKAKAAIEAITNAGGSVPTSPLVCDYNYASSHGSFYLVGVNDANFKAVVSYHSDENNHTRTRTQGTFEHSNGDTFTESYEITENPKGMGFSGVSGNHIGDYNITLNGQMHTEDERGNEYNPIIINNPDLGGAKHARVYLTKAGAEAYVNSLSGIASKFAGKTFYIVNETNSSIESWAFNTEMTEVTFVDGTTTGTDGIKDITDSSFCITEPSTACTSTDILTIVSETSNSITVNIDNTNLVIFNSLSDAQAYYGLVTTYNAYGYEWTDEKKDSRYTLDGNYVEFNSADEWFQLKAMEDNNTKSRAEIKASIGNKNGMGAVVKLKSGATNGTAQLRLYTFQNNFILPTNAIPGIDSSTAYSMAVLQVSAKQIKARVYVEDANGNFATIFDQNITTYDDNNPNINRALKFLIKLEEVDGNDRIMFKTVNPEDNTTIGNVAWFNTPNDVSINTFEKAKVRANTDAVDMAVDRGLKFNLVNVFELIDDSTTDDSKFDKNNTLAFPDTYFDNKKYFGVDAYDGDVEFFQATFSSNGGFLSNDYGVNSENELVLDGNGSGNWTRISDKVINLVESWSNSEESCDNNLTLYLLEDNTSADPAYITIGGDSNEVCIRNGKTETYSDEWVEKLYVGDVTTLSTTQIAAMVEEVNENKYDNEMNYPFQIVGTTNIPAGYEDANINLEAQPILTNHNEWRGIAISSSAGTNDFILGVENVKFILKAHINTPNGHSEYIYDKASDKWLNDQEVNWIPVDEYGNVVTNPDGGNYNHIPDVEILDGSDFNGSNQLGVDFDLVAIENSTFRIIGQVITASDYSPMTYCTNNYSSMNVGRCEWDGGENGYRYHVGENAINIEFMDMSTGQHMGWTRLENGTENNGSQLFNTVTKFSSEGNYTARLNINTYDTETGQSTYEGYYINPTDGSLISDQLVEWAESNVTDNNGYKMWMPNLSAEYVIQVKDRDGNRTSNYATVNFLEKDANQFKLNGRLTSTDGMTTYIELIDVSNGRYFGWSEIKNGHGDFNISLKNEEAEYIVRINKSSENKWESYYYDVNETDLSKSKFVIDNGINWNEIGDGVWLPDTNKTGTLRIYDIDSSGDVTKDDVPTLDINFADMDSQFYTIEGNVIVASNFEFGEKRDSNDNWVGYSNIGLEITDTEGRWVAWKDISNDEQCTENDNNDTKTCQYKIRLSEADDYILRINKNKYVDGSMEYKGFYIDTNGDLISDRKVPFVDTNIQTDWGGTYWAPDTNVVKVYTLNDSTNNIVQNINFVEHANSTYKLEGVIKLPDGFILDNNSETYSMIKVEALNANTGE